MIQLVFAYCPTETVNGEIEYAFGMNGGLPWKHIPQDLANFKRNTMETILLMGSKTFASLPGKLPGRKHYVFHNEKYSDLVVAKNGDKADVYLDKWNIHDQLKPMMDVSVIGGKGLLEGYIGFIDKIIMTVIHKKHYVPSTVKLDKGKIDSIKDIMSLVSRTVTVIDELTSIEEFVYVRKT